MKICPNCEIEFEDDQSICPLCLYSEIGDDQATEISDRNSQKPDDKTLYGFLRLSPQQKRKLFWEISVIVLLSGMLITMAIDLILAYTITWSKYCVTVCLVLFANVTLFSFLRHKLFLLLTGSFVTTSLLLVLLDIYNERIGWGTQLGIPLLLSLYMIVYLLALLFRYTSQHGFNMLGFIFIFLGLLSMCIEAIVSHYVRLEIHFSWSLIVMVCLIPIAVILFYIHYRLKKGAELRRFFHI